MARSSRRRSPTTTKRPKDPAAKAGQRERREERKRIESAARQRATRHRRVRNTALAVAASAIVATSAFFLLRPDAELPGVERPPNRGRGHLAAGEVVEYETPTPTSGRHAAQAPRCGSYSNPLAPELAVHALEHGTVVIWYQSGRADELAPSLENLLGDFDSHVIVSPNDAITDPIVATAWNRLKRYTRPGAEVAEFVQVYRKRGPEKVDCDI
jgi:hypothetical protein